MNKQLIRSAVSLAVTMVSAGAHAYDFTLADDSIKASLVTNLTAGGGVRTKNPSCSLTGDPNRYGCGASANVDQWGFGDMGDLNYRKGQAFTTYLSATSELLLTMPSEGLKFMARGTAYYDFLADSTARTSLSSDAKAQLAQNAQILDLWGQKDFHIGDQGAHVRLGNQVINWGESVFASGGINATNSVDIQKLLIPGTQLKQALLPAPMVSFASGLGSGLSMEAYYQFQWNGNRYCLRKHPFLPNLMLLELFKRRGNATKLVNLRYSREDATSLAIPMDGVTLIRSVREATESLVTGAKAERQDRLWLYRAEAGVNVGRVVALTGQRLALGISALVARRDLRGDDGEPLRLNLSRLRKTLEQRLWTLSGGDLIATAALMGQHPTVADRHYLVCTEKIRENATFVGEALAGIYERGPSDAGAVPILPGKSPTGRCKDPYNGDKAPKNGKPCDDFLSCFACTSYTIVGSPDDLHRLFSFYWFLDREMTRARTPDWQAEFRNTMNLIDRFTADKFDVDLVEAAKTRAKSEPLSFWAAYSLKDVEITDD